jgi:adenosylcobinamide-phosphate synthase
VYEALRTGTLADARKAVSMIVGRDTDVLDEAGVTRAAVETVAENTSDGEVAPLFYIMLLGPLGGCLYKAVNTMDSMVGYRNRRYEHFGTCAARLDDVMNYIPARLSALLMIAGTALCGMDAGNARRIWKRDRRKHASPNSAQTEAVMAGALRVRLAGDAQYFGEIHRKPYIGDDIRPIEAEDIRRSHRLLYLTSALMFALAVLGRMCVYAAL